MRIGKLTLETRRPDDLDEQLVAATGCSSREIERLLAAGPDRKARAVLPFLTGDVPDLVELARAIAGDRTAVDTIRALYARMPAPIAPAEPVASTADLAPVATDVASDPVAAEPAADPAYPSEQPE